MRVRRVRFRSQDDRFAILDADADGEPVTPCLRDIPLAGEAADVLPDTGHWQTHPTHGRQVVVHAARAATSQERRAALSFLGSIDGVGPGLAEKLMALLGAGRTTVYRAATHRRERRVARRLRELAAAPIRPDGARASARPLPGELTEQQQQAIRSALTRTVGRHRRTGPARAR